MDCGACGHKNCEEFEETQKRFGQDFIGPTCLSKTLDLRIALDSAIKIESMLNIDNCMYRVGAAALKLNLLPEATVIMGIPVSAKGKNIYFDRSK